ncbi:hypothetical protein Aab01nite_15630 [Paractinoplanes abujensis]|uniref:Uncharacterized protein n=1 Tax=Paractinoplanes abujensis TaxID=882441 RepID=A0A7W7CLB4_9ACTN|nr:hypothetical protein [Actinoplanes abujensis]MBB4690613.1 hypothetical protein [Actinoplanes abujensis]GID17973.1 hypothetical protein Aab01nite_15630 [Actinoplanes abujensis]
MELQSWHLVVVVALAAAAVWAVRVAGQRALAVLAVAFVLVSGWLLNTLVLDEAYLEPDLNSRLDAALLIAAPALIGVGLGVLAVRRRRSAP